jgi:hypothetical protein
MSEAPVLANRAGKLVHGSPGTDCRNPKTHSGTDHIDNVKGALVEKVSAPRFLRVRWSDVLDAAWNGLDRAGTSMPRSLKLKHGKIWQRPAPSA